jgi:hypothetical protein
VVRPQVHVSLPHSGVAKMLLRAFGRDRGKTPAHGAVK